MIDYIEVPKDVSSIELAAHMAMATERTNDKRLNRIFNYPNWLGREAYYKFLYILAFGEQPEACLELGVYMGVGLAHMAAGYEKALCVGVDIALHPNVWYITEGYNNIRLVAGDTLGSFEYVRRILDGKQIGLMHIDAMHDAARVLEEISTYEPLMAPGCLVCLDDVKSMDGLWESLDCKKYRLDFLHEPVGYGVVIPKQVM